MLELDQHANENDLNNAIDVEKEEKTAEPKIYQKSDLSRKN